MKVMDAKLKLNLSEYHERFLRKELNSMIGPIVVNRDNSIGKFIDSTILWAKEKPNDDDKKCLLLLPCSHEMHREYYWAYVTLEREKMITDFIQSNFLLNIELFFAKGYRQGYSQKQIIEAFIYHYNLYEIDGSYDMIKKRDFRKRKNIKKIIAENILKQ